MKTKLLAIGAILLASCGPGSDTDPLVQAWQLFSDGKYADAHAEFVAILSVDETNAYVGLGWTTMKMDSINAADKYFTMASNVLPLAADSITLLPNDSLVHGYAGWAFVAWLKEDYQKAIDRAHFVLRKEPEFKFEFDTKIAKNAILLTLAESYFSLSNYQACIDHIKLIDTSFTASAGDANIKATLLAKLEALSGLIVI